MGLEPLLRAIRETRATTPETAGGGACRGEVADAKAALEGARDILAEELGHNAPLVGKLRAFMREAAFAAARVRPRKEEAGAKFSDYLATAKSGAPVPPTGRWRSCARRTRKS